MKALQLISFVLAMVLLVGCETTQISGARGNQEAKHLAALERQRQQPPLPEDRANLWNAHEDMLNRDSNPLRAY